MFPPTRIYFQFHICEIATSLGQPDTLSFKCLLYQSSHPHFHALTGFSLVYRLYQMHQTGLYWSTLAFTVLVCSSLHYSAVLLKSLFLSHPLSALGCLPAIIIVALPHHHKEGYRHHQSTIHHISQTLSLSPVSSSITMRISTWVSITIKMFFLFSFFLKRPQTTRGEQYQYKEEATRQQRTRRSKTNQYLHQSSPSFIN